MCLTALLPVAQQEAEKLIAARVGIEESFWSGGICTRGKQETRKWTSGRNGVLLYGVTAAPQLLGAV